MLARGCALLMAAVCLCWGDAVLATECKNPDALGISRTVELDTSSGPEFGAVQYRHADSFLNDKEVVLTFDDGPFPGTTPAILDALDAECTTAVFFYVGRMALAHPDILAEVDARGHTIGAHTWGHANFTHISADGGVAEIEKGVSMLEQRLGHPIAPFFRFPYLADTRAATAYLKSRGFGVFSADVDSWDSHGHIVPAERIVRTTMARIQAAGRGIILLHDIKPTTAAAVPVILAQLKAKGFKIVRLVPKTPATSVPSFDQVAQSMIATYDAKMVALAAQVAARTAARSKVAAATDVGSRNPKLLTPLHPRPALQAALDARSGAAPADDATASLESADSRAAPDSGASTLRPSLAIVAKPVKVAASASPVILAAPVLATSARLHPKPVKVAVATPAQAPIKKLAQQASAYVPAAAPVHKAIVLTYGDPIITSHTPVLHH